MLKRDCNASTLQWLMIILFILVLFKTVVVVSVFLALRIQHKLLLVPAIAQEVCWLFVRYVYVSPRSSSHSSSSRFSSGRRSSSSPASGTTTFKKVAFLPNTHLSLISHKLQHAYSSPSSSSAYSSSAGLSTSSYSCTREAFQT